MTSTADLAILMRAQDEASGPIGKVGGALSGLGGLAIGAAAVGGAAVVGLGAAAFKLGESFDSAYDTIRVGTGATGEALEGLKGDFREVATQVPADFDKIGAAISDLNTRTGQTGPELQGLATQFLNLNRVVGGDLATSIAAGTRLFGDWGVAADDQNSALDMMFRASQSTGIGFDTLNQKLVQFGAPLRAMGFDLGEAAAMMGKWEKEGVNAELVLGSFRIAMGKFAKEGVPMREGLDLTMRKIQELGPGAEATGLAMKVFGARAGPDMAAAILEGRFELGELLDAVKNGEETINTAAEDTADFAEKWQVALNTMAVAFEPVGTAMFSLAGTALDVLAPRLSDAFAIVVPAATEAARLVEVALNEGMGTAFSQLVTNIEATLPGIQDQLRAWGQAFVEWLAVAGPPMLAAAAELGGKLIAWSLSQVPVIIETLATWAAAFVDWVAPQIPGLIQKLVELMAQVTVWMLTTGLPALIEKLDTWGQAFVDWIGPKIPGLLLELATLGTRITQWMGAAALNAIKDQATGWGKGITDGLVDGVSGLTGALGAAIRNAISGINFRVGVLSFSGGSISVDVGGVRAKLASLENFDGGGIVGGPTGAPRLVVAHGGEGVFTPSQMSALSSLGSGSGSGGGATVINVNFSGPVYGVQDLRDAVMSATSDLVRQGRMSASVLRA